MLRTRSASRLSSAVIPKSASPACAWSRRHAYRVNIKIAVQDVMLIFASYIRGKIKVVLRGTYYAS
eukprot:7876196-Pyramimonas_sp.AAC.2